MFDKKKHDETLAHDKLRDQKTNHQHDPSSDHAHSGPTPHDIKHDPKDTHKVDHKDDHVDPHPMPGQAAKLGDPATLNPPSDIGSQPTTPTPAKPGTPPAMPASSIDDKFDSIIADLKKFEQTNEMMNVIGRVDEAKLMFHRTKKHDHHR